MVFLIAATRTMVADDFDKPLEYGRAFSALRLTQLSFNRGNILRMTVRQAVS